MTARGAEKGVIGASAAAPAAGPAPAASIPFRRIADATYDWESWLGPEGTPLWVNPAVERITGYDVAESIAMERYPLPMVAPEDRARIEQVLQTARSGSSGNDVEFRVLRKDGGLRWAAISWQSFGDEAGRSLGFRTSIRDIHERKLAEKRLHEALAIAEQSAAARQTFLANTSHELRTPLQSILGYAQLLAAGEPDADSRRKLDIIIQQTESLLSIVSNVLEMAALQVKAPEIVEEEFDLRRKVADVIEAVRPLTTGKALEIHSDVAPRVPRRVRGDRLRVRQVLTNLIANAVKFTERGRVDVRVTRTAAGRIRFVIEDTGIGIGRDDLARLFLPFERAAEATRRGYGGTGLGLSIAKALTDAMGGTLSAASRRQGGSRFTLELPLAAVEARMPSGGEARAASRRARRPTVLVVDDSPVGRELVCEMLQGLGAEVRSAATGAQAVAEVLASPPELVLMDLQMPDLDGATTAQLIRAQTPPGAPRPRIVALTANAFGRAQALGCATDQGRPIDFEVQPFQNGLMLRRSDIQAIYVYFAGNGQWEQHPDRWMPEMPPLVADPDLAPPSPGLVQPERGIGLLWAENNVLRGTLGWATAPATATSGEVQTFDGGLLIRDMQAGGEVIYEFLKSLFRF